MHSIASTALGTKNAVVRFAVCPKLEGKAGKPVNCHQETVNNHQAVLAMSALCSGTDTAILAYT